MTGSRALVGRQRAQVARLHAPNGQLEPAATISWPPDSRGPSWGRPIGGALFLLAAPSLN